MSDADLVEQFQTYLDYTNDKTWVQNSSDKLSVWFDEAHWAIEDWINEPNKKELLEDNKYIKDRIFSSASPNKSIVNKNNHIFGELYSAIKVKELITL